MQRLQRIQGIYRVPILKRSDGKVSLGAKIEAAHIIREFLRRRAEGALDDPTTWKRVADDLPLLCEETCHIGGDRGSYYADRSSDPGGTNRVVGIVTINTSYPPEEQARAWAHELAHYCLHTWSPPQLQEALDLYEYEDDRDDVSQDIARFVEQLFFDHGLAKQSERKAA